MTRDISTDTASTPGVMTSGVGYRATAAGGAWRCPHVHFTQQSAKACAAKHANAPANAR